MVVISSSLKKAVTSTDVAQPCYWNYVYQQKGTCNNFSGIFLDLSRKQHIDIVSSKFLGIDIHHV